MGKKAEFKKKFLEMLILGEIDFDKESELVK
jgi:hypothetical protein